MKLKLILNDMHNILLLRVPSLGLLYNNANEALTASLGNPQPGGCFVSAVVKGSALDKAGVLPEDMIYAINSHSVDVYGELCVPWSEDKISIVDYVRRLNATQSN